MKVVLQRVTRARVEVENKVVGEIEQGLLLLLAAEKGDSVADALALAQKIAVLRVFPGRTPMDLSVQEVQGACLVVSQFTIAGRVNRGRRPSFDEAEAPALANELYEHFCRSLCSFGIPIQQGVFGAHLQVELINDGPVTLIVQSIGGQIQ